MTEEITSAQRAGMRKLISALTESSDKPLALFLGAGASKPFGYPITRELMFQIFRNVKDTDGSKSEAKRTALHEYLVRLLPGERLSQERVPMVTGVLSLLDHSIATGQVLLPETTLEQTRDVRATLEQELIRTIPDDETFSPTEESRFNDYCGWLTDLYAARSSSQLGIITTNYDMVADLAACYVTKVDGEYGDWRYSDVARKIDYGFRWNDPYKNLSYPRPEQPRFSLYKLHGSTNWLRCPLCENLYINPDAAISNLADSGFRWRGNECHCSHTLLESQIVSPSFLRSVRDPNLIATWRNALDLLREADHWVVIGYSFPDEDVAIRALFTRALGSNKKWPTVSIVQRDIDSLQNYESFFPQETFTYYTGGLELLLQCARS